MSSVGRLEGVADAHADPLGILGIREQDGRGAAAGAGGAGPAADLVVVGLGQRSVEGEALGVLVELGLPAPGDGGQRAVARDPGGAGRKLVAELPGALAAAHLGHGVAGRGGRSEIGRDVRDHPGLLEGHREGGEQVARRRARLQARLQGDDRRADALGQGRERAAAGDGDELRAARHGGLGAAQRLEGLARVGQGDQQRVSADEPRQRAVAAHHDRHPSRTAPQPFGQVGADRRAAETRDADGARLAQGRELSGLGLALAELVAEPGDVAEHLLDGGLDDAHRTAPLGNSVAPLRRIVPPATSTSAPTMASSSR